MSRHVFPIEMAGSSTSQSAGLDDLTWPEVRPIAGGASPAWT